MILSLFSIQIEMLKVNRMKNRRGRLSIGGFHLRNLVIKELTLVVMLNIFMYNMELSILVFK